MDIKSVAGDGEDGPSEKRTRRQRKSLTAREGNAGGVEGNYGKVLRSHTRRNTEKTAATEWVSSRDQDSEEQQTCSPFEMTMKQNEEHLKGVRNKNVDNVGERRKEMMGGGGGTASVISLSSSYQESSNERKVPPEQAELGGTTSKTKSTIEDTFHMQAGSSSQHSASTMREEVGRARKSERNEASMQPSSSCSDEISAAPTSSLLRPSEAITTTQHSKLDNIVGTAISASALAAACKDEVYTFEERVCSAEECRSEEMSEGNARRSPKESTCSSTQRNEIDCKTRFQANITGGLVGSHRSPPCLNERGEEKKVFGGKRLYKTDEDELATSLKTLVCVGGEETKLDESSHQKNSFVEVNCELAESSSSSESSRRGHAGRTPHYYRDDDDGNNDQEWEVKISNNEDEKCDERILLKKEKSRIVLSPCRRPTSNMIQGGVEATLGTEAPFAEEALRTSSSPRSSQSTITGSPGASPKKKVSVGGSSKKRNVSERVNESSAFFKFKKPQQNKRNLVNASDVKSDNAVSDGVESSIGGSPRGSVEPKRTQLSSLVMSNLPYMGELTFDTRPRRGRKPKKADICHLISKNYGIYFPSATQDTHVNQEPHRQFSSASAIVATKSKLDQGPKTKQGGRENTGNQNATRCSPVGRPIQLLSSAVPAFYNRDVSIVPIIPTAWNASKSSDSSKEQNPSRQRMADANSTHQFTLHRGITQTVNPQETISMFPLNPLTRDGKGMERMLISPRRNSDDGNSDESGMDVDPVEGGKDQDMPLNLCLRDDSVGKSSFLDALSLSSINAALDVRWRKGLALGMSTQTSASSLAQPDNISSSVTFIPGGNKSVESPYTRKTVSESNQVNLVSGRNLVRSSASERRNSSNNLSGVHINSPEISVSIKNVSPEDISSLSFSHRIEKQLTSGGKDEGHGLVKQSPAKRKKELVLRPTVNSAACSAAGNAAAAGSIMPYSPVPAASSTPLSSLGGRLFGQSSGGINDGAEVSICKFKFTGGAKPSLQEKKMLSVDSGGNFRFYTDKANNGITTKLCKGHQFAVSSSSKARASESATTASVGKHGMASELSVRPEMSSSFHLTQDSGRPFSHVGDSETKSKNKKSATSSALVKSGSKRTLYSTPSMTWNSTSGASQTDSFSLIPTRDREDSKYLRLSMEGDQGTSMSSCGALQYQVGEDSNSSSNSCSSSDDSNESSRERKGFDLLSDRNDPDLVQLSQKHFQKHQSSPEKLKSRGKRRTRKSLMREKLEKTFKEKGFLIQTQQLESAEGATYCKFRQLRKFTRYLFRSWKDYLPDTVKEISDNTARTQSQGKECENPQQSNSKSEERASPSEEIFRDNEEKLDVSDLQEDEIDVEEDDAGDDDDDADEEEIK